MVVASATPLNVPPTSVDAWLSGQETGAIEGDNTGGNSTISLSPDWTEYEVLYVSAPGFCPGALGLPRLPGDGTSTGAQTIGLSLMPATTPGLSVTVNGPVPLSDQLTNGLARALGSATAAAELVSHLSDIAGAAVDGATLALGARPLAPAMQSLSGSYTVSLNDNGTVFDNGQASSSITVTLPGPATAPGFNFVLFVAIDQVVVIAAPANTLVGKNSNRLTTYTTAGSGEQVGVAVEGFCNGGNWFLKVDEKGMTPGAYA